MKVAIIGRDNNNPDISLYDRVISIDPFSRFFVEYNPTDEYFNRVKEVSEFYKQVSGYRRVGGVLGKFIANFFAERQEIEMEARVSLLFDREENVVFYNFTSYPFLFLKQHYVFKENYNRGKIRLKILKELISRVISFFFDRTLLFMKNKYRKSKKYRNIVKVWVEASLKIYEKIITDEKDDTLLFLQPFNINKGRQKKALNKIKEYDVDFYRNIYYLSLWEILRLIGQVWCDLMKYAENPCIVLFRMDILFKKYISQREANRILKFSPKMVFTKEEFKSESILVSSILMKNNVHVCNTMHGTGLYNMNQIYSVFRVYGDFFKDFYSDKIIARYSYYNPFSKNKRYDIKGKSKKNVGVVMQYINSKYSVLYYERIIEIINGLLGKGYTVYVKNHPNMKDEYRIKEKKNLIVVDSAEELYSNVDIIITGFSTMGYEAVINGKVCLFFNDKSYNLTPIGFVCPEFVVENDVSLFSAVENIVDKNIGEYWEKERGCIKYVINGKGE